MAASPVLRALWAGIYQNSGHSAMDSSGFDEYNSKLQGTALKATRLAASLPLDLAFHRTMGKDVAREIDTCSTRVMSLANQLLNLASTAEGSASKGKKRARLEAEDDVVDDFQALVADVMDRLLENTV